ncbi:MAG: hypothetical protein IKL37_01085 [Alphaproteobacteria bacterium]|nr:hypothetical protein [Alphaproteobacteria bacterium]
MDAQKYTLNVATKKHTIATHGIIHPLDVRLDTCKWDNATLQLETYHTLGAPGIKVGVIAPATGIHTYKIGDTVNVISQIPVNLGCVLTNIVKTDFLAKYIANQR